MLCRGFQGRQMNFHQLEFQHTIRKISLPAANPGHVQLEQSSFLVGLHHRPIIYVQHTYPIPLYIHHFHPKPASPSLQPQSRCQKHPSTNIPKISPPTPFPKTPTSQNTPMTPQ
ncbi:uncharacterized protein BO66DRAFT_258347 [Aspergillus aculeatinus CBS 121060]|uniref:Uncharacterized protein n=1 Tax=Aspergillus aculeatinus CBS 121060 TaxID=1448322 RepID=A0ACD1GRB5_9EURO|nr:hypothetical protein BO66DRAFT_258347 [Aspergillus aculeatinus CBS 121060]RAH63871.1 hypothetical protein BO66DRAFT_258347 [Aspergillus aculeatinus CBS 121060]